MSNIDDWKTVCLYGQVISYRCDARHFPFGIEQYMKESRVRSRVQTVDSVPDRKDLFFLQIERFGHYHFPF